MKKFAPLALLIVLAACKAAQPADVQVPTEAEFEANPQLLADWMKKCTQGEYSNRSVEDHSHLCGSAQAASAALSAKSLEKKHEKLFQ